MVEVGGQIMSGRRELKVPSPSPRCIAGVGEGVMDGGRLQPLLTEIFGAGLMVLQSPNS